MSRLKQLIQQVTHSTEAVDYQFDGNLHQDLSKAFYALMSKYDKFTRDVSYKDDSSNVAYEFRFNEIIRKHLNMNCTLYITSRSCPNACVDIDTLYIDPKHPVFSDFHKNFATMTRARNRQSEKLEKMVGGVDLKNSKLTGYFSEHRVVVRISPEVIYARDKSNNFRFTPGMLAAIIMHELGHIMSYFETFTMVYKRNMILQSHLVEFAQTKDINMRITLVRQMKKEGVIKNDVDVERVIEDSKSAYTVIVDSGNEVIQLNEYTKFYDQTIFESLSDQFAIRHGAGQDLALGLAELHKDRDAYIRANMSSYTYTTLLSVFLLGTNLYMLAILGPLVGGLVMLGANMLYWMSMRAILRLENYNTYDSMEDRFARIRREMIGRLKYKDISDKERNDLVEQLDRIDALVKELNKTLHREAKDVYNLSWFSEVVHFFADSRKDVKNREHLLENLMNNDLFISGARFK